MIISVASGKGGTGKTTVSTNLAASLDEKVTFLDCDVEEPNAHLFLKPEINDKKTVYSFVPQVIEELCNSCRKCADICRFRAITVVGSSVLVFPEMCHGCGGCMVVCPEHAIWEGQREVGKIESGTSGNINFNHGILRIGEAMSPPLIKDLRKNNSNGKTVIIDAPPGTSCPVIAAIKDTDYILLVTEPTPFGLHDLVLAHKTVQKLGIPCGLVINRADMGDYKVRSYALENDLPILLEIPFDKRIAELYSRGLMLVEEMVEWKKTFKNLYRDIMLHTEMGEKVQ